VTEFTPIDPDYEARVRSSFEKQGVMQTIGATLTRVAPGEVVIEFAYDPSLTQQHGYIHAGVVTTVVDSACGYAAYTLMPPGSEVLSIEYKVNFMYPAKGESFKGIGKVLRSGRTITVCSGDVVAVERGKEKVVATMLATMISVAGYASVDKSKTGRGDS
jgi:uncharacterized protein (TIGR00369 family)